MSLYKYIFTCEHCGATYCVQDNLYGGSYYGAVSNLATFLMAVIQNEYEGVEPCCRHVDMGNWGHNSFDDIDDKFEDKAGTVHAWMIGEKKRDRFESILE